MFLVGVFAYGMPNVGDLPPISFVGQTIGAIVMAAVGFIPGYAISWVLKKANALRVPKAAEELGLDEVEIIAKPYPEANGVPAITSSDVPNKLANPEPGV